MSFITRQLTKAAQGNQQKPSDITGVNTEITRLTAFQQLNSARYPFLLASSADKENNTQYDILPACPQFQLTLHADHSLTCSDKSIQLENGFFETLERLYQENKIALTSPEQIPSFTPPFIGGWFVYLAYEMAQIIEPSIELPPLPDDQPLAIAVRCPAAIIFDKTSNSCIALAEQKFEHLLDAMEEDFKIITSRQTEDDSEHKIALCALSEAEPQPYLQQVEKIKQYIVDGDIFQANLSRLWQARLADDVSDSVLFSALCAHNPSSFAAMACLDSMSIISSSPERLVSLRNNIIETRPIAGTRPRDKNKHSDDSLASELMAHPKEQAEHIMLIDLERNDLGRVCRPGTIEVNELMVLESWQHVHHIVSNVRGEIQIDKSPIDVLKAVFPGGTITGCPKVRCMEILAELEQQPRGAYTGSLGYINNDGSMDFNILIRTLVRNGKQLSFRAGGGIVNDSIAANELEETRAKAKGLLRMFSLHEN